MWLMEVYSLWSSLRCGSTRYEEGEKSRSASPRAVDGDEQQMEEGGFGFDQTKYQTSS
jgi:hypothetical protein